MLRDPWLLRCSECGRDHEPEESTWTFYGWLCALCAVELMPEQVDSEVMRRYRELA